MTNKYAILGRCFDICAACAIMPQLAKSSEVVKRGWPLKMGPTAAPETSSANLPYTPCQNSKTKNQYSFHGESLKSRCTRWFKYDRDKLWLVYTQIVPVIFEPPCIYYLLFFQDSNGYANAPQCYVTRALSVLFYEYRWHWYVNKHSFARILKYG